MDYIDKEFTISCHYCEYVIETKYNRNCPGLFSLINAEYAIVNGEGDKEAVCNRCLGVYEGH